MAFIEPFRAWHYNDYLSERIAELTASISETKFKQPETALYAQPFHSFHLASPVDVPPFENVDRRLKNWKIDKVIKQEALPTIFPYEQTYQLPNSENFVKQKGFIVLIKIEEWQNKVVLPHEKTFAEAVQFRTEILKNTYLHTSPTHGLYQDNELQLEPYLEESLQVPFYEVVDEQGTQHKLSKIQDWNVIRLFKEVLNPLQVIIADGHHRYESSIRFMQHCKAQNPQHTGNEAYNYHLIYLTNSIQNPLGLLPTHRLLKNLTNFSATDFLAKVAQYFEIENLSSPNVLVEKPFEKAWAFGLVLPDEKAYYLKLRKEAFDKEALTWQAPFSLRNLDIAILHRFLIEKVANLHEGNQFEHLDFAQYSEDCIRKVRSREVQVAILTHKVPLQEIFDVCQSGYLMPQKATYFFPKVLSGLLFATVLENEFYPIYLPR
ncbi:MAG: DUF1015 domain-containing protein [Cytophagales bacterium]|nr:MAG: DUF1015 domain-containing protein [Cytophagales bacterium]